MAREIRPLRYLLRSASCASVSARSPRTAFVLSGGGNQSVAQVGMLRALLERDIVPDVIVGCSAGAFNGATIAAAPSLRGVERLEATWDVAARRGGLPGRPAVAGVEPAHPRRPPLLEPGRSRHLPPRRHPATRSRSSCIPLRVVAADLDTGDEVVFSAGPLQPALLASAALPGIFPPIRHDGRTLVDGAVVDTVPLWHALSGPVDRIYVMNVAGDLLDRPLRSPIDVAVPGVRDQPQAALRARAAQRARGVELVQLPAPLDERELFDFSGGPALMEAAYELADDALDDAETARRQPSPAPPPLVAPRRRLTSCPVPAQLAQSLRANVEVD